jgi:hypothetical protein
MKRDGWDQTFSNPTMLKPIQIGTIVNNEFQLYRFEAAIDNGSSVAESFASSR